MGRKKKTTMPIINPNRAGIDVGSKSHYVALGQSMSDVREFGVYAEDLTAMAQWLKDINITSVAMESTGMYWKNLFIEFVNTDIKLILTAGKFTKNH